MVRKWNENGIVFAGGDKTPFSMFGKILYLVFMLTGFVISSLIHHRFGPPNTLIGACETVVSIIGGLFLAWYIDIQVRKKYGNPTDD